MCILPRSLTPHCCAVESHDLLQRQRTWCNVPTSIADASGRFRSRGKKGMAPQAFRRALHFLYCSGEEGPMRQSAVFFVPSVPCVRFALARYAFVLVGTGRATKERMCSRNGSIAVSARARKASLSSSVLCLFARAVFFQRSYSEEAWSFRLPLSLLLFFFQESTERSISNGLGALGSM